jgi:ATP-dependent helicase/nuclease subunit B
VISTVLSGLEAALGGFEQRSVLRYLRTVLSPLDPDTCDLVENYAVIWGIRGSKWLEEWSGHPEGLSGIWTDDAQMQLRQLNAARELAMEPLKRLAKAFGNARNLAGQVEAIYDYLERLQLEPRLEELAQQLDCSLYLYNDLGHAAYEEAKDFNQRIYEFFTQEEIHV